MMSSGRFPRQARVKCSSFRMPVALRSYSFSCFLRPTGSVVRGLTRRPPTIWADLFFKLTQVSMAMCLNDRSSADTVLRFRQYYFSPDVRSGRTCGGGGNQRDGGRRITSAIPRNPATQWGKRATMPRATQPCSDPETSSMAASRPHVISFLSWGASGHECSSVIHLSREEIGRAGWWW